MTVNDFIPVGEYPIHLALNVLRERAETRLAAARRTRPDARQVSYVVALRGDRVVATQTLAGLKR